MCIAILSLLLLNICIKSILYINCFALGRNITEGEKEDRQKGGNIGRDN